MTYFDLELLSKVIPAIQNLLCFKFKYAKSKKSLRLKPNCPIIYLTLTYDLFAIIVQNRKHFCLKL